MKNFLLATVLVASSVLAEPVAGANGIPSDKKAEIFEALNRGVPHVTNEMLVQFSASATQSDKGRALRLIVGQRKEIVVPKAKQSLPNAAPSLLGDLELVTLPRGLAVSSAMRSIERDSAVIFAEPNWIYKHQATSNDPYVTNNSLWGMSGSFGSQATIAWTNDKTDCSSVYVGIIDEGYQFSHSDLATNAAKNPGEVGMDTSGRNKESNGVDDDGNGLTDDVRGWDFAGNNNTVFDGLGDDHGTHVAGTIGGVGGNGTGVAGVCWNVKLLNTKFLGSNGGTTANAIKAVDYFTGLKTRHGLNLVATNNSWGGGGFSQPLKDAIDRANVAGILFIAAAGNSTTNCDLTPCYPSSYLSSNLIAVASITSGGAMSSFSSYGATSVDLGAPGSAIWSTVPVKARNGVGSGYASYSGTSMATPHVTGAAALYAALNPKQVTETPTQYAARVKEAILSATISTPSLADKTVTGGRLNVGGF